MNQKKFKQIRRQRLERILQKFIDGELFLVDTSQLSEADATRINLLYELTDELVLYMHEVKSRVLDARISRVLTEIANDKNNGK